MRRLWFHFLPSVFQQHWLAVGSCALAIPKERKDGASGIVHSLPAFPALPRYRCYFGRSRTLPRLHFHRRVLCGGLIFTESQKAKSRRHAASLLVLGRSARERAAYVLFATRTPAHGAAMKVHFTSE